ncbi:MAG: hypothetical protein N4A46_05135 [Schleiferiaceae bacterium]|nr:hypothetical protein [Schleiferiaceae bacterium]
MLRLNKLLLTGITLLASCIFANGQGCSDAGFCTAPGIQPEHKSENNKNKLRAGAGLGSADYSIAILSSYITYTRELNDRFNLSAKLTYLRQSGNGISASGLGDFYINSEIKFTQKFSGNIGVKLPLNNADKSISGLPLPMDYQSSLGTTDLIAGLSYNVSNWIFALAVQQPLTQNNNQFLSELYPEGSSLRNIQSTNQFQRSGDGLLRASYAINTNGNFIFTPGLLAIYHFTEDKYTTAENMVTNIQGSDGLTLNGNFYFDYLLNEQHELQLIFAFPFLVREARPDGLTRSFILNLQYSFNF